MRFAIALMFLIVAGLGMTQSGYAQSNRRPKSKFSHAANSRPNKSSIVCPIFNESRYPYQGIGIKLGDPFALTYKFYASRSLALSLDVGKTASGL